MHLNTPFIKPFILIFLINTLLFNNHTYAQTEAKPGKNYITTGIAYPFFRTFTFGYERMISKTGFIRVNASIQPLSKKDSYEWKMFFMFYTDVNKQSVFTSKSVSVGYGLFIFPKAGFYVASDLTYRYNYFENKYYYQCTGMSSDSKVSLLSEYHNEYGLQNMAGIKLAIIKYKGISLVADFNVGIGIYWNDQKHLLTADRQGTCSASGLRYYDEPIETHSVKISALTIIRAGLGLNF